jgi:DNA polymerase
MKHARTASAGTGTAVADAMPFVPTGATLGELREAVQGCRGCPLYRNATQAVLGEGRASARIVMVGEQPGDREDVAGRPFVGPGGCWIGPWKKPGSRARTFRACLKS